ncbi:MAG: NUDIX hydrolase [Chloroflexi bacterium]|nr:NUDIX hydrolase [Chloroflexota bacterium]
MHSEETLDRKVIYRGKVVGLHVDTIKLPGGGTAIREIIEHTGAVAMVPVGDDERVWLVRQYRKAAEKSLLEIPAGTRQPGEDPVLCARRELQEEIGQIPGKLTRMGGFYPAPGVSQEFVHIFLAQDLTPSQLAHDDDESLEIEQWDLAQAVQAAARGEFEDGKTIIGLLMLAARNIDLSSVER